MKLPKRVNVLFENEKTPGILLILCTVVSLLLSNTAFSNIYTHFWHTELFHNSVEFWINDALMAVFFLLIGLELKTEILQGQLANIKNAMLPIFGALGGMIVPAGLFLMFTYGTTAQSGAGIPMATDIAFALGILALLGNRVPISLKVFLTALAVIDDLGAILIIAFFYTKTIIFTNLFLSLGIFVVLLLLNKFKVKNLIPYLIGGIGMWYFMLHSGVHATITGVLLAFTIPIGGTETESPLFRLQHFLHKPVSFVILPLFALANTAIILGSGFGSMLSQNYSLGIIFGLVAGKPIGIFLLTYVAAALGICKLPNDLSWKSIIGVGFLGGIGFTMSIFITLLAFDDQNIISNAKFTILLSSLVAGILGFVLLQLVLKKETAD